MPTLYVMVGIMGSGKSTVAEQISENNNATILSSDKLRLELFGDEGSQEDNSKVFETLYERARELLKDDRSVIIDAMNISRKRRMHMLTSEFRKIECEKVVVYVATPIEECIRNDENRSRTVTAKVIRNAYRNLDVPTRGEGWDEILYAKAEGDNDIIEYPSLSWQLNSTDNVETFEADVSRYVPQFRGLYNISQDNQNHAFSIGRHIYYTLQNVKELFKDFEDNTPENYGVVMLSAFFHDIGKKDTKRFIDTKGNPSKYAHFYNHEKVSAQIAVSELIRLKYPKDTIEAVADLVQFHMELYKAPKKNGKRKVEYIIPEERYKLLLLLNEADKGAH